VTSSCKSKVMFEGGMGNKEEELLNRLFLDETGEEGGRMISDEFLWDKQCGWR